MRKRIKIRQHDINRLRCCLPSFIANIMAWNIPFLKSGRCKYRQGRHKSAWSDWGSWKTGIHGKKKKCKVSTWKSEKMCLFRPLHIWKWVMVFYYVVIYKVQEKDSHYGSCWWVLHNLLHKEFISIWTNIWFCDSGWTFPAGNFKNISFQEIFYAYSSALGILYQSTFGCRHVQYPWTFKFRFMFKK